MKYVCKRTWVPHDHALSESFWRGGLRECRALMGGGGGGVPGREEVERAGEEVGRRGVM